MPMASFSASYSCIASAASRARSSFAAIVARCWAFFKVVAIGISSVPAVHCGFVTWQKRTPRLAGQTRGSEPQALPVHPWSKRYGRPRCRLRGAQILSSRLTSPAVCNDVEGDLLPLVEGTHACAFDRADMNEDILVASLGLNEAEAFFPVKPLHTSLVHGSSSFGTCVFKPRFEILGRRLSVRRAIRGEAKSFGRNSMNAKWLSH